MNQPTTPTIPFAMRCTQEQFDDVKEELEEYKRIYWILDFTRYPVLLSDKNGVTNTGEWYCKDNSLPPHNWDKSLFLKMAGKTDPESRELIGYKINTDSPITAKELGRLLDCSHVEMNGLFFWEIHIRLGEVISGYLNRAITLGIVGEGKWLVPVYATEPTPNNKWKPIAMRCTEEEFESVREELSKRGGTIFDPLLWNKYPYLVNNLANLQYQVSCSKNDAGWGRTVFESFDREILMEYCGGRNWEEGQPPVSSRITGTYEQQKGGER